MKGRRLKLQDTVLDKYRIVSILKDTDDVVVCLAEHIFLNTQWVIKQFHRSEKEDKDNMLYQSIQQEVEILKELKHPGIPLVIDVFSDKDTFLVVREYMDGISLSEYVHKNGVLEEGEVIDIGIKLCEIFEYLHGFKSNPLIYRDLKPDNIIITDKKEIKLIDFGIARFYRKDKDYDTTYLGTRGFAAPEQYGISQSDTRTDVFGIGATLYYLLSRRDLLKPPYKHEPIRTIKKNVSKAFESILHQCLLLKKEGRYATVQELRQQLEGLVVNEKPPDYISIIQESMIKKVGIKGLKHGAGVTYCCLKFALFLQKSYGEKYTVYLLDLSDNQKLDNMRYHRECRVADGVMEYRQIKIITKDSLLTKLKKNEEIFPREDRQACVCIDFGLDLMHAFSKIEDMIPVVVAGISPWEIDEFEEYVLSPNAVRNHYVINYAECETFDMLKESIYGFNFYQLPMLAYDQKITDSIEGPYKEILIKEGWDIKCSKKEKNQYFLKVGNYIENFRERIKPLL